MEKAVKVDKDKKGAGGEPDVPLVGGETAEEMGGESFGIWGLGFSSVVRAEKAVKGGGGDKKRKAIGEGEETSADKKARRKDKKDKKREKRVRKAAGSVDDGEMRKKDAGMDVKSAVGTRRARRIPRIAPRRRPPRSGTRRARRRL